jgi:hypothetical protein
MTGRHAAPDPGPRHAGRAAGRHADPDRGELYQPRHARILFICPVRGVTCMFCEPGARCTARSERR